MSPLARMFFPLLKSLFYTYELLWVFGSLVLQLFRAVPGALFLLKHLLNINDSFYEPPLQGLVSGSLELLCLGSVWCVKVFHLQAGEAVWL